MVTAATLTKSFMGWSMEPKKMKLGLLHVVAFIPALVVGVMAMFLSPLLGLVTFAISFTLIYNALKWIGKWLS